MVQAVEHVQLRVQDLEDSINFYKNVLGMVEYTRDDDVVYLGCGLEDQFDIALEEGGTGMEHFAVRVDEQELENHQEKLDEEGISYTDTSGAEPGQESGSHFEMPSGISMEFITVESAPRYSHITDTAYPNRSSHAPVSLDHINVMSQNVQRDAEFLESVCDFKLTEVQQNEETDNWDLVFSRYGDQHHDVGIGLAGSSDVNLHHVAWTMTNADHLITMVDELVRNDLELEAGISRHLAGNNLFAYFWGPGGNRIELSTEMSKTHSDTETLYRDRSYTFTSWGGIVPPESFHEGS